MSDVMPEEYDEFVVRIVEELHEKYKVIMEEKFSQEFLGNIEEWKPKGLFGDHAEGTS